MTLLIILIWLLLAVVSYVFLRNEHRGDHLTGDYTQGMRAFYMIISLSLAPFILLIGIIVWVVTRSFWEKPVK